MESIRVFLALEMPRSVKTEIARGRSVLERELPPARWVRPDALHLTLKFLGDLRSTELAVLVDDLRSSLARLPAAHVKLGGGGFFPNPELARVAWIGGEHSGVTALVEAIESAASRANVAREVRGWSIHLTQARLRRPWSKSAVERFLDWALNLDLPSLNFTEVVLFSSALGRGGAVYTALERFSLV